VDESQRQLVALLAQGSIAGALIYIIIKVGNALVAKVAGLATELADHTRRDLAEQQATRAWISSSLQDLRDRVIALDAKHDAVLDMFERTPVEVPIPQRPQEYPTEIARIRNTPRQIPVPDPGREPTQPGGRYVKVRPKTPRND
jgi:hypothetical protein